MATEGSRPSFWVTLPGILTAVAGLVTALTGLLVVLVQLGDDDAATTVETPPAASSSSGSPSSEGVTARGVEALVGTWAGDAAEGAGDPFRVRLDIVDACRLEEPCGTIFVGSTPCRGRVTLWAVRGETYEMYVDDFVDGSSPECSPGAGDFFELLDDGTLRYTTGYAPIEGVLERTG